MTTSCYRVIQCGDAWAIRSGNRTFGPLSGWQSHRPAKVLVQEGARTLRAVWTYDPSTPGNPANSRGIAGSTGHIGYHHDPV
jgi:hypothetical protein